jgi:hypothetical protein
MLPLMRKRKQERPQISFGYDNQKGNNNKKGNDRKGKG